MPVTKVTAGKSRRVVKATNVAAESKDSTNLADSTSIDVDKSDSPTDDECNGAVPLRRESYDLSLDGLCAAQFIIVQELFTFM